MYQGMSGDCDFPKILEIFSQRLVFRIASWILVSDVSHLLQLMSSKIRLPQWCGWAVAAPSLSFIKMDRTTSLIKMLESLTSFMPQVPLNMKVCVCVGEFDLTSFIQFILYLNSIDFSLCARIIMVWISGDFLAAWNAHRTTSIASLLGRRTCNSILFTLKCLNQTAAAFDHQIDQ